jgi:hypothetical protein
MKRPRQFSLAVALGVVVVVGALASSALAQTERTASELGQAAGEPAAPVAGTERTASEFGQAVGEPGEQGGGTALYARTPTEFAQSTSPEQGVTSTSSNAFDWGDAAIGAATALGLSALAGLGGLVVLTRRRRANDAVDVPVAAS